MDQKSKAREFIYGVLRAFDDEIIDLADRADNEANFQPIKAASWVRDQFFDETREVPLDMDSVHGVLMRLQASLAPDLRSALAPVFAQIAVQKDYLDEVVTSDGPADSPLNELPDTESPLAPATAADVDRILAKTERVLRGLTLEVASKSETAGELVSAMQWIQGRRDAITDVVIEAWMLGRDALNESAEALSMRVLGHLDVNGSPDSPVPDLIRRVAPASALPRLVEDLANMACAQVPTSAADRDAPEDAQ